MEKLTLVLSVFTALLAVGLITTMRFQTDAAPASSSSGQKTVQLSPDYEITVIPRGNDFVIQAIVKTKGFVGFGISKTGLMDGADIFIGGVNQDGKLYGGDYHGVGHQPVDDKSENWEVIRGKENDTHTMLEFSREYKTDDLDEDQEVMEGETPIIWSIGNTDDVQGGHRIRGSARVVLKNGAGGPQLQGRATSKDDNDKEDDADDKDDDDDERDSRASKGEPARDSSAGYKITSILWPSVLLFIVSSHLC